MNQIIVRDSTDKEIGYITAADGAYEAWVDERSNGDCALTFKLPLTSEKFYLVEDRENTFRVGDKVFSHLQEDSISIERTAENQLIATVNAMELQHIELSCIYPTIVNTGDGFDHIDEHMVVIVGNANNLTGGIWETGSAGHALYALLEGSGWSLGACTVKGKYDLETDKESLLDNIAQVQNLWGGILVWDSLNKTVSLYDEAEYEPYSGFKICYQKNIKQIEKVVNNDIITRLYVYGDEYLDISEINDGKKYIEDFTYSGKIRTGIVTNNDIGCTDDYTKEEQAEIKEQLKQWGLRQSQILSRPRINYKTTILDLSTLPEYNNETFRVNDICEIIDTDVIGDRPVSRRIVYHKFNVFNPLLCELEIGDTALTFEEIIKASYKTSNLVTNRMKSNGKMSGYLTKIEVNSIINQSEDKIMSEVKRVETSIDLIDKSKMYRVQIVSSNGNIFKNGLISTTLRAILYSWDKNITAETDASRFRWTRISADEEGDKAWNTSHFGGTKEITITSDDVQSRATFQVDVLDETLTRSILR
ncbi:MAG: phage tail protein [Massilioclostridium sp.]|nr:phage tail protein [Massilioclostridium sp.]